MAMERVLCVDPGKNGGVAWVGAERRVNAVKMPDTDVDILDMLRSIRAEGVDKCVIERQFFHMCGNNAVSSAKFARHCGLLMGILVSLGYSVEEITPAKWQRKIGAMPKDKKERKRVIKDIVQKKYPALKVTFATADALGILMADASR